MVGTTRIEDQTVLILPTPFVPMASFEFFYLGLGAGDRPLCLRSLSGGPRVTARCECSMGKDEGVMVVGRPYIFAPRVFNPESLLDVK